MGDEVTGKEKASKKKKKNENEEPEAKKPEVNNKPARKVPKKIPKEQPEGDEKPEEKPKKTTNSFARRPCPKTSPASDRWVAIQSTFKALVMPRIHQEGGSSYSWEDWG